MHNQIRYIAQEIEMSSDIKLSGDHCRKETQMEFRKNYIETGVLATMACTVCALSLYYSLLNWVYLHLGLPKWVYDSGLWNERIMVIRFVISCYGIILAATTCASYLLIRFRDTTVFAYCVHGLQSVAKEIHNTLKWLWVKSEMKNAALCLAMLSAVGLAIRCFYLAQPMQYDEAYTFLYFVDENILFLFWYPLPNNHVLHTLLVRISVDLFGAHPVAIRLPAMLAGVCVIPVTYCFSRLISGNRKNGLLACAMVAVFPYIIFYDTMARGYSLLVLLSLSLAILGFRLIERPSLRVCFLLSLVIALGFFVMPSFLFPAVGLLFWILVMLLMQGRGLSWILLRVLLPCSAMAFGLTGLFYTPTIVISGFNVLFNNRYVKGLPWSDFLNNLPSHIFFTANQFSRDIPTVIIVCAFLLFAIGVYSLVRKKRWNSLALLPCIVLGGVLVLFLKHAIPYDRTWIYLLPFIFVFMDAGFADISFIQDHTISIKIILILLTGGIAVLFMNHAVIDSYPDGGRFPEAPTIVRSLSNEMNLGDEIDFQDFYDTPVYFYMREQHVPHVRRRTDNVITPQKFSIVRKGSYSLEALDARHGRKLLEIGDIELYVSKLTQETANNKKMDALDRLSLYR